MPRKKKECSRCGHLYEPYPYEINVFITNRLNSYYQEALKNNLLRWQLDNVCPYCREVVFGQEPIPDFSNCPLCGLWTRGGICAFCGQPLRLKTIYWVGLNLKRRGVPRPGWGFFRREEEERNKQFSKEFNVQARQIQRELMSSSRP